MASIKTKLKLRIDTGDRWTQYNPILLLGEMGIEIGQNSQQHRVKIGDGVTEWNNLDYSLNTVEITEELDYLYNQAIQKGTALDVQVINGTLKIGKDLIVGNTDIVDAIQDLYSQIKSNTETLTEAINTLSDTKLDKITSAGKLRAYVISTSGTQETAVIAQDAQEVTLAQRHAGGALSVGTPAADTDAATKKYVDSSSSALQGSLDAEINRAIAAEKDLQDNIDAEKTRATTAEQALQTNINTLKTNTDTAVNQLKAKDTELQRSIATNSDAIDAINAKIPEQASSTNQLADKAFVNSSIENNAARFITPTAVGDEQWASLEALRNATVYFNGGAEVQPTQNDYATYLAIEDGIRTQYRAIYQNSTWNSQYKIGSAFTADQTAAINSNITAAGTAQITTNKNAIAAETTRATAAESALQDSIDAEKTRAETAEQSLQDNIDTKLDKITSAGANRAYTVTSQGVQSTETISQAAQASTIAQRKADSALTVGTPTADTDATTKKYVDDAVDALDALVDTKVDKISGGSHLRAYTTNGTDQTGTLVTADATTSSIPYRSAAGTFSVSEPLEDSHVATKKYIDSTKSTLETAIEDATQGTLTLQLKAPDSTTTLLGTFKSDNNSTIDIPTVAGPAGEDGVAAGFGIPIITATQLDPGEQPTATITATGPDTAKVFNFALGIPRGVDGRIGRDGYSTYSYVAITKPSEIPSSVTLDVSLIGPATETLYQNETVITDNGYLLVLGETKDVADGGDITATVVWDLNGPTGPEGQAGEDAPTITTVEVVSDTEPVPGGPAGLTIEMPGGEAVTYNTIEARTVVIKIDDGVLT